MAFRWHGKRYNPPQELPAGFYDRLISPLAIWLRDAIGDAYETGYRAGRLDELDAHHPATPPTGRAPVTPSFSLRL